MQEILSLAQLRAGLDGCALPIAQQGTVVTIGKFESVHLGHQEILRAVSEFAREHGLSSVVFTFTKNPLATLNPEACPEPILSPAQRLERFQGAGIDVTVMVEFDDELRAIPAEDYVRDILLGALNAKAVFVGRDFRFGHKGAGDVALLQKMGAELGFEVFVTDDITSAGARVSSTAVRDLIAHGDVSQAAELLGCPVENRGEVVHGAKRGRDLGFPTANLAHSHEGMAPGEGVYVGFAILPDGRKIQAAISVGSNPTFTPEAPRTVEAFLLDFDEDLYGQIIAIQYISRLRGNIAFDSIDALIEQMRNDVLQVENSLRVLNS